MSSQQYRRIGFTEASKTLHLQSFSAHFGRRVAGDVACPSPDARLNDDVTDCEQPLALRRVTSHCAGRNSCTLQPTTEFFDEPCEGVYKMLDVKYLCS